MSAQGECRPPPNTPDGTLCWLYHDRDYGGRDWCALVWWRFDMWSGVYDVGANRAARFGWRFHSIATPPQETNDAG